MAGTQRVKIIKEKSPTSFESIYLFPSVVGESFFGEGEKNHLSMSIAECHCELFYCYVPLVEQSVWF